MKVLYLDEEGEAPGIVKALSETGVEVTASLSHLESLGKEIQVYEPQFLFIVVRHPSSSVFKFFEVILNAHALPALLFVESIGCRSYTERAIQSGITTYVENGLNLDRIPSLIEVTKARHSMYDDMQKELNSVKQKLQSRVLIEKAKGLLMEYQNISEAQAYRMLQKTAMDHATSLHEIAEQTISAISKLKTA